jgi:hypothetical protein
MIFGVALVVALACLLGDRRRALPASRWRATGTPWAWLACGALATLANYPVLSALPALMRAPLPGDAATHGAVCAAIARDGLPHGWVDTFEGGFPIAVHYPLVGWSLVVALLRMGISVEIAVHAVGLGATLATPVVAVFAARSAGARPVAALSGAVVLAWLAPFYFYQGGWEVYLMRGLLSQAVAWPLAVLAGWGLASRRAPPWFAPLTAVLFVAAHPQVAIGSMLVMFAGVVAAWDRAALVRYARAAIASCAVAAAQFAPGVRGLRVPFGWPPAEDWKMFGFPPERLIAHAADGSLMDDGRAPVISLLWLFATAALLAFARRRAARVALAVMAATAALTLGGRALTHMGALGAALLSFIQPMRIFSMVPLAAALCVVVAAEELLAGAKPLERRIPWTRRGVHAAAWLGLALGARLAMPARVAFVRDVLDCKHTAEGACRDYDRADVEEVRSWLPSLDRGRLDFQMEDLPGVALPPDRWAFSRGVIFASGVPLGNSSGVGAHVGVNQVAFSRLRVAESGSATRAEALGVRFVLHRAGHGPAPGSGWSLRRAGERYALSERVGGTDTIGVGCVTHAIAGSDPALRTAFIDGLKERPWFVAEPRSLWAIERSTGAASTREVASDGCSADGATVAEARREPGAYEATVDAPAPVDVVIRASAYETWRVRVDGVEAPVRAVAPGFPSVRVPAGRHRIEAVASLPRWYFVGLAIAGAIVIGCCRRRPLAWPAAWRWPRRAASGG